MVLVVHAFLFSVPSGPSRLQRPPPRVAGFRTERRGPGPDPGREPSQSHQQDSEFPRSPLSPGWQDCYGSVWEAEVPHLQQLTAVPHRQVSHTPTAPITELLQLLRVETAAPREHARFCGEVCILIVIKRKRRDSQRGGSSKGYWRHSALYDIPVLFSGEWTICRVHWESAETGNQ